MVNDDMLSQDEIDALLKGTGDLDGDDLETDEKKLGRNNIEDYFSIMEQDALGEIGNISYGNSATALSTLLNQKVEITTPSVSIVERDRIEEEFPQPYVAVLVNYTEGFSGTNLLVIKQNDAAIIADLMLGGDGKNPNEQLDEIQLSAIQEAMNQMMGSSATSMSTIFSKRVDISPPVIDMLDLPQGQGKDKIPEDDLLVKVSFHLKVGDLIDSELMQLLPIHFARELVNSLLNPQSAEEHIEEQVSKEEIVTSSSEVAATATLENETMEQPQIDQREIPLGGQTQSVPPYSEEREWQVPPQGSMQQPYVDFQNRPQHFGSPYGSHEQANIQPAVFSSFEPYQLEESEAKNLNMLLDIPLEVTVELGRTKRAVKEILELSSGSIIELDKLAGEPVDILVNNRLIAKGEVVVIDENFGVRVTDIVSQSDRIKKLR